MVNTLCQSLIGGEDQQLTWKRSTVNTLCQLSIQGEGDRQSTWRGLTAFHSPHK